MPDREEIFARTRLLPVIQMGTVADDEEIWAKDEANAHFKVTKEILPNTPLPIVYALSVSGSKEARDRIVADFRSAFGDELTRKTRPRDPYFGLDIVLWDARAADRRRPA